MGGFRQWIKKLFKSKPDRILRKPFEDVKEFYTIHKVLGSGTYAVTYLCTEKSTGKSYACKTISKMRNNEMMKKISEADHKKNIRREIQIMQLLSGRPNIVGFKSVHEDEKFVHLVMDLCAGGELPVNRQYDEHDAARICRQIVEAVHACHSIHVIHRDVKPQNLLFSTIDHRNAHLKLSDFGVSVFTKEGRYEEDTVGTAPYIAPEVLDRRYGKEADMWSAGVILYSLLSGKLPFQGPKMDKAIKEGHINLKTDPWPSISQDAKDLLSKMLTRNPKDRITAAQALAHPWIRSYGGRRKSLKKKLLELITIKKLKELARKVRIKIKVRKRLHDQSRRRRYN